LKTSGFYFKPKGGRAERGNQIRKKGKADGDHRFEYEKKEGGHRGRRRRVTVKPKSDLTHRTKTNNIEKRIGVKKVSGGEKGGGSQGGK